MKSSMTDSQGSIYKTNDEKRWQTVTTPIQKHPGAHGPVLTPYHPLAGSGDPIYVFRRVSELSQSGPFYYYLGYLKVFLGKGEPKLEVGCCHRPGNLEFC